jgi:hypothetical protein
MAMPQPAYELLEDPSPTATVPPPSGSSGVFWGNWVARLVTILVCLLHSLAAWVGIGGWSGMVGDWPILIADHGFHYHHGVVTRNFLLASGMSAGYDPSFMAGFPMSVISGTSSTLVNLVILAFGRDRPAVAFKVFTFLAVAGLPWLVALAALVLRSSPRAVAGSVLLFLFYFWTDWPINYADFGMTSYLLSVPLGLVTVALLSNYLARGGFGRWFWAAMACAGLFLVHLTSAMVVAPAGLLAYLVALNRARRGLNVFPVSRHVGLVAIVPLTLLVNAFWLLPGYWLASTAGESDFVFAHREPVSRRLVEIVLVEAPIETISLGAAFVGLVALGRRWPEAAAGLGGLLLAGFGWGYLAGFFRSLDPLQPGRHTFTCYSAACLAGGIGLDEVLIRLRSTRLGRLDRVTLFGLVLASSRIFGPALIGSYEMRFSGSKVFLSSQPTPRMLQVIAQVKAQVRPGERLLFEETGFPFDSQPDPYDGRHISPILPHVAGVEVIGGPYLHTPVETNFTQFGENKLFGRKNWDRDYFVRYAKLYRPAAICCWSQRSRAFCLANPDLIRVVEDDGTILLGRVIGFEGSTIQGTARVEAGPNRLVVHDAEAEPGGDGLVVLRYHYVPYLTADPPTTIEPVKLAEDPVPFIGLRPTKGPVTIQMVLPLQTWLKKR